MTKAKLYVLTFVKKEKVSKDTYTFYFKRGGFPDFIPGQYIRVELPHKADDRGTTRYFTISSSPLNKKYLTITTRIIQSTFKKALVNLKPGTKVNVFGPMGWFLLPKDEPFEKIFISGGIGVTPFHSLLTTLEKEKLEKSITLVATFSSDDHVVFHKELLKVSKNNSQINVVYSFSKVSEKIIKKHVSDLKKPVYYVVGSETMVAGTKKILLDLGIEEEKIQTEDFTGY
jgi:ferredoxin-NADP reductase